MKLINGKTKLDEKEQLIVKHGWILSQAEIMGILVNNSYVKDFCVYLETNDSENDINKFMTMSNIIPYCHWGFKINGKSIK